MRKACGLSQRLFYHTPSNRLWFRQTTSTPAASAALPAEATPTPKGGHAPLQQPIDTLEQPRHSGTFWAVEPPLPIVEPGKKLRNSRFVPLCFDNPESAYRDISTYSLTRGIAVLSLCKIKTLVQNADQLYSWSRRLLGPIPAMVMRHSFFAHFCAGEDQESIQPTVRELHKHGIGSILDYAAESDVHSDKGVAGADSLSERNYATIVRTYEYESEKKCDSHVQIFMRALEAAKTLSGQGFAAIKVTALGNPNLLHMISRTIEELTRLFARFDRDCNGYISKDEFFEVYHEMFTDDSDAAALFDKLDQQHTDRVDYVSFIDQIKVSDIPQLTSKCRERGPLKEVTPTEEELHLLNKMVERVRTLCKEAADANLRIMIDAEHNYLQPAIDSIAKDMMAEFNRDVPIVYNTYQCYLRDSRFRLNADIESARRRGYKFGAKLVRGAYMVHEDKAAAQKGVPSPVYDGVAHTHSNYNRCIRMAIQEAASAGAEVMIATHNQYSVEMAVRHMHDFGMKPGECGVYFGQLLGMADHLSYVLGRHSYRAYKYVPFGPVEETIPYLIRRAQENSGLLGGVAKEMEMRCSEVSRRLLAREA